MTDIWPPQMVYPEDIRKEERERCAKLCDDERRDPMLSEGERHVIARVAWLIRNLK